MKHVLVTGTNGFIGSHMCQYLLSKGYQVSALLRTTSDLTTYKLIVPTWRQIRYYYGDLRAYSTLIPIVKDVEYIYHIAGTIKGSTQKEFQDGNYCGTKNLLRACLHHNPDVKRIVVISSMVAGGPGPCDSPQCEDLPTRPLPRDFYGISKFMAEQVSKHAMLFLPITIVRPPTVIGPGDHVSLDLFKIVKLGLKTFMTGTPRYFSIVHVSDLVRGIYICSQSPEAIGQIFNFACHGMIPYRDLHEVIGMAVFLRPYGSLIPVPIPPIIFKFLGLVME